MSHVDSIIDQVMADAAGTYTDYLLPETLVLCEIVAGRDPVTKGKTARSLNQLRTARGSIDHNRDLRLIEGGAPSETDIWTIELARGTDLTGVKAIVRQGWTLGQPVFYIQATNDEHLATVHDLSTVVIARTHSADPITAEGS